MLQLHCSKKMITKMPSIQPNLKILSEKPLSVVNWHAHLVRYQRKQCLFFCNDESRYLLFAPAVTKPSFQAIHLLFLNLLEGELKRLRIAQVCLDFYLNAHTPMTYDTETQRSVTGSLNLTYKDLGYYLHDQDVSKLDLNACHNWINQRPMGIHGKYVFPEEAMFEQINRIYLEAKKELPQQDF